MLESVLKERLVPVHCRGSWFSRWIPREAKLLFQGREMGLVVHHNQTKGDVETGKPKAPSFNLL